MIIVIGIRITARLHHSVCAPLCCKNLCCASLFCMGGRGTCRAADPSKCPRGHEENASSGAQSGAPGQRWKPGHQQYAGQENQYSQRKLNQHSRPFPELHVVFRIPSVPKLLHNSTLFWKINVGRRNVKITSQKLSWNSFWAP